MTVTNVDGVAHDFAYYVWDATDEVNQLLKARDHRKIGAGETAVITVGLTETCGTRYQRDLYIDIPTVCGCNHAGRGQQLFSCRPWEVLG